MQKARVGAMKKTGVIIYVCLGMFLLSLSVNAELRKISSGDWRYRIPIVLTNESEKPAIDGVTRVEVPIDKKMKSDLGDIRVINEKGEEVPSMVSDIVEDLIMPVIPATGGALALDFAWNFLPLPESVANGFLRHVAKMGGAIAMALGAERVFDKRTAELMGVGAMTVVAHGAAKEMLQTAFPDLNLGYYSAGPIVGKLATTAGPGTFTTGQVMGAYVPGAGMQAYVPGAGMDDSALGPAGAMSMYVEGGESAYYG